jgi:hypothetical protein
MLENRCKAKTKTGSPCGAAATAGGLCFFHANPNKASELGRIGGRKRRSVNLENAEPPPCLDTVQALRDLAAQLIRDVYAGKLNPRVATGLAPLLNLQLRTIELKGLEELATLQQRVDLLEKMLSRNESAAEASSGPEINRSA